MFAIAAQQNQYQTYVLSDQTAQSSIEVVPERGGIVTRWRIQGQEIFYLDEERFTHPELTVRGGIPILFPICGNLPDNTYTHNGQSYTLKQHGFARNLPWEVSDRSTDNAASLTLKLASNDETRAAYPFDFRVFFTYSLKGNTLEIQQRVINDASEPLPFSLGLHPYFLVNDKTKLEFDIPATEFYNQREQSTTSFSGQFDLDADEIDVIFLNPARPSATVTDRDRHLQLLMEFDAPYAPIVFWTVKGKNFYCIEPWTAPRNAMITGDRLIHLPPQETLDTSVRFSIRAI
jgi:galactose mutarotase-like enzyme